MLYNRLGRLPKHSVSILVMPLALDDDYNSIETDHRAGLIIGNDLSLHSLHDWSIWAPYDDMM